MKTSNPKFDVVILGGPGSGKSTQAKMLVDHLNAKHLNMGGLLRQAVEEKAEGHEDIARHQREGTLVADSISAKLAGKFVANTDSSEQIVFDGYPRTLEQAKDLDKVETENDRELTAIYIKISREEAKDRLLKRAKLENRSDDTAEVIEERLDIFERNIEPITEHYRAQDKLAEVNGEGEIDDIHQEVLRTLK